MAQLPITKAQATNLIEAAKGFIAEYIRIVPKEKRYAIDIHVYTKQQEQYLAEKRGRMRPISDDEPEYKVSGFVMTEPYGIDFYLPTIELDGELRTVRKWDNTEAIGNTWKEEKE